MTASILAVDALPMRSQMTFWRCAVHQRQTPKIVVLGDYREIMLARIGPDFEIGRASKTKQIDVGTVGELVSQRANQARTQVLIEQ